MTHVQYTWLLTEEASVDAYERYELYGTGGGATSAPRKRWRLTRFFNPSGTTCLGRVLALHSSRVARWESKQRKRSDAQMRAALKVMGDDDAEACAAYRRAPPHARPGHRRSACRA